MTDEGADQMVPIRWIRCFGRVCLTRLPRPDEPPGIYRSTIHLGDDALSESKSEIGMLYLTEYPLNTLFNVEIKLTPISEEERKQIARSRPVLL